MFHCSLTKKLTALTLQIQTVAKTARVHRNEWVENADRLVAGFLEMFEEGCHKMVRSLSVSLSFTLLLQQKQLV